MDQTEKTLEAWNEEFVASLRSMSQETKDRLREEDIKEMMMEEIEEE